MVDTKEVGLKAKAEKRKSVLGKERTFVNLITNRHKP
jgi:hypothetical protein